MVNLIAIPFLDWRFRRLDGLPSPLGVDYSQVVRTLWQRTVHRPRAVCHSCVYPNLRSPESFVDARAQPHTMLVWLTSGRAGSSTTVCTSKSSLGVSPSPQIASTRRTRPSAQAHSTRSRTCPCPPRPRNRFRSACSKRRRKRRKATLYPTTIQNLSPRACRPILRRILEPNPDHRVLVEDILKNQWIVGIEVVHGSQRPAQAHAPLRRADCSAART
jgi:hypothetical protein